MRAQLSKETCLAHITDPIRYGTTVAVKKVDPSFQAHHIQCTFYLHVTASGHYFRNADFAEVFIDSASLTSQTIDVFFPVATVEHGNSPNRPLKFQISPTNGHCTAALLDSFSARFNLSSLIFLVAFDGQSLKQSCNRTHLSTVQQRLPRVVAARAVCPFWCELDGTRIQRHRGSLICVFTVTAISSHNRLQQYIPIQRSARQTLVEQLKHAGGER